LYLLISADKKEAVEKAEAKIREIMSRGSERVRNNTLLSLSLSLPLISIISIISLFF
jgi:predicted nucleic acid-binding Zn ribbon protein